MARITRSPASAETENFDLIIVGGGIYGAMLSLEACRRGLRPLLLERGDFGQHTSFNSLRIIHGGLRYLQSLDLQRFRDSMAERHWFLKNFPGLARPLHCLMPLYGEGLRKPHILKGALFANDLLSYRRNRNVPRECHLDAGRVIPPEETKQIFPDVDTDGLKGGAVWCDAFMPDSQRLIIEIIAHACEKGAKALNYVEALELLKEDDHTVGIRAEDRETRRVYEFKSPLVINTAGPWSGSFAAGIDPEAEEELFRPSLAWNMLLDRDALSDHAVAVAPRKPNAHTYFLVPWKGRIFAGTGHVPWTGKIVERPMPSEEQTAAFLADLNLAIPGLDLKSQDILRIFSGLLPASRSGTAKVSVREVILDHEERGGPVGFWSVSGVKFTTARRVADKALSRIFQDVAISGETRGPSYLRKYSFDLDISEPSCVTRHHDELRTIIEEESVVHLDDLMLRRTNLGDFPKQAVSLAPMLCHLFDWDNERCDTECERIATAVVHNSVG